MAATNATNAATLLTKEAASNPAVQQAANADQNAGAPTSSTTPTFDLASFLGLPTLIDWQDLAIRAGLVLTGIILLVLVAWSFVRGQQTTNVNVQLPNGATEAAEEVV